jgi:hypothetical protein
MSLKVYPKAVRKRFDRNTTIEMIEKRLLGEIKNIRGKIRSNTGK